MSKLNSKKIKCRPFTNPPTPTGGGGTITMAGGGGGGPPGAETYMYIYSMFAIPVWELGSF